MNSKIKVFMNRIGKNGMFALASVLCVSLILVLGISTNTKSLFGALLSQQACVDQPIIECIKNVSSDNDLRSVQQSEAIAKAVVDYVNANKEEKSSMAYKVKDFTIDSDSLLKSGLSMEDHVAQLEEEKEAYNVLVSSIDQLKETKGESPELVLEGEKANDYLQVVNEQLEATKTIVSVSDRLTKDPLSIKTFTEDDFNAIEKFYGQEEGDKYRKIKAISNTQISTSVNANVMDLYFDTNGLPKINRIGFFQHGAYMAFPLVRVTHKNDDGSTYTWTAAHSDYSSNKACTGPSEWSAGQYTMLDLADFREFRSNGGWNTGCAYSGGYIKSNGGYYLSWRKRSFSNRRIVEGDILEFNAFVRGGSDRNYMKDEENGTTMKFAYSATENQVPVMDKDGNFVLDQNGNKKMTNFDQALGYDVGGTTLGWKDTKPLLVGKSGDVKDKMRVAAHDWTNDFFMTWGSAVLATIASVAAGAVIALTFGVAAPVLAFASVAIWTGIGIAAGVVGACASLAVTMGAAGSNNHIENVDLSKQNVNMHYKDSTSGRYAISGFSYANNGYYNSKLEINYKEPGQSNTKTIKVGCGDKHDGYCRLGRNIPLVLPKEARESFKALDNDSEVIGVDIPDGSEVWANAIVQGGKDRKAADHFTWSSSSNDFAGYVSQGSTAGGDTKMNFTAFGTGDAVVKQMSGYILNGGKMFKNALINAAISFGIIVVTSVLTAVITGAVNGAISRFVAGRIESFTAAQHAALQSVANAQEAAVQRASEIFESFALSASDVIMEVNRSSSEVVTRILNSIAQFPSTLLLPKLTHLINFLAKIPGGIINITAGIFLRSRLLYTIKTATELQALVSELGESIKQSPNDTDAANKYTNIITRIANLQSTIGYRLLSTENFARSIGNGPDVTDNAVVKGIPQSNLSNLVAQDILYTTKTFGTVGDKATQNDVLNNMVVVNAFEKYNMTSSNEELNLSDINAKDDTGLTPTARGLIGLIYSTQTMLNQNTTNQDQTALLTKDRDNSLYLLNKVLNSDVVPGDNDERSFSLNKMLLDNNAALVELGEVKEGLEKKAKTERCAQRDKKSVYYKEHCVTIATDLEKNKAQIVKSKDIIADLESLIKALGGKIFASQEQLDEAIENMRRSELSSNSSVKENSRPPEVGYLLNPRR